MDLHWLTTWETAALLQNGELSPLVLVEALLARIERLNPLINAFITLTAERARQDAHRAEDELAQGKRRGPLHGIPLALKDLYETAGIRTTCGSRFFDGYLPAQNAVVVDRLEQAGTVLLGKLNMHEIALGVTNVNPFFGPCRNPWNLERISGGSSGGSGAALAAGLCQAALGSDTGGSIRIPASLCGVVGLKPTRGRVSLRGLVPLSWNLDHAGPMARCVRDAALLLQAMAGYDRLDSYSADQPVEDWAGSLEGGVRGWRISLAEEPFFSGATHPEVWAAVDQAAKLFEQLGARLRRVPFPGAREAAQANGLMTPSDAAAFHQERLETAPQNFGEDVRRRLEMGAAFTATQYALARQTQNRLRRQFEDFFSESDVLLTPATPVAAPPVDGPDAVEQARLLTRFTAPFNLTGLPAISIPCGFTREGLPVGLQIVARPWAEAALLQAAHTYEQAAGWHLRHPQPIG